MAVEFQDFSFEVKAALNEKTIAWLREWSNTIASKAKDTCTTTDDDGELRKSYRADVDDSKGEAQIGSPLESAFWEEFGTGSYADTSKNGGRIGRPGWWIYTPGNSGPDGYKSNIYATKEEAEEMAAYIRAKYDKEAVVTNGREPNYTLEKAFTAYKTKAIDDLENVLKEMDG